MAARGARARGRQRVRREECPWLGRRRVAPRCARIVGRRAAGAQGRACVGGLVRADGASRTTDRRRAPGGPCRVGVSSGAQQLTATMPRRRGDHHMRTQARGAVRADLGDHRRGRGRRRHGGRERGGDRRWRRHRRAQTAWRRWARPRTTPSPSCRRRSASRRRRRPSAGSRAPAPHGECAAFGARGLARCQARCGSCSCTSTASMP